MTKPTTKRLPLLFKDILIPLSEDIKNEWTPIIKNPIAITSVVICFIMVIIYLTSGLL